MVEIELNRFDDWAAHNMDIDSMIADYNHCLMYMLADMVDTKLVPNSLVRIDIADMNFHCMLDDYLQLVAIDVVVFDLRLDIHLELVIPVPNHHFPLAPNLFQMEP